MLISQHLVYVLCSLIKRFSEGFARICVADFRIADGIDIQGDSPQDIFLIGKVARKLSGDLEPSVRWPSFSPCRLFDRIKHPLSKSKESVPFSAHCISSFISTIRSASLTHFVCPGHLVNRHARQSSSTARTHRSCSIRFICIVFFYPHICKNHRKTHFFYCTVTFYCGKFAFLASHISAFARWVVCCIYNLHTAPLSQRLQRPLRAFAANRSLPVRMVHPSGAHCRDRR